MGSYEEKALKAELLSRGLAFLLQDGDSIVPISLACSSTRICSAAYTAARNLQPELNRILDLASRDKEFIIESLSDIASHDDFVKCHLDIYREMTGEHLSKPSVMLNRHDYMFHTDNPTSEDAFRHGQFKLVEFNLAAASMGSLADGVNRMHGRALDRPVDSTVAGFADALVAAHNMYLNRNSVEAQDVVVACVGNTLDFNYFDQQHIINSVNDRGVRMVRYEVQELTDHLTVDSEGRCRVSGQEVSVFYLRSLYDPDQFLEGTWEMRRKIELSRSIPVPSIPHQIVNMKLFQLSLARKDILSKYTDRVGEVLELFHDTLTLESTEEGDRNAQLAVDSPERYVMKPQREGGGNNFWEGEMRERLLELAGDPARQQYILMRRITPPVTEMRFFRGGEFTPTLQSVSEIGFYSTYISEGGAVVRNENHGLLVRTKNQQDNEGGVYVGISVLGSPHFID